MGAGTVLTFNPGSSSIKLGLFAIGRGRPRALVRGEIDLRLAPLTLRIADHGEDAAIPLAAGATDDLHAVIDETMDWLVRHAGAPNLSAVGHRVVHGGDEFAGPAEITDDTLQAIEALVPLAPLHQPQSLRLIRAVRHARPDLPQSASFDTVFHRSQADLVRRYALPRALFDQGVKRYGFHGLSFKFIAEELGRIAPDLAGGRVVVAHLGSGASLCGLLAGTSRDTSMGFSALDGVPMATRPGSLDPGIVIHLIRQCGMTVEAVEDMLYRRAGLLGVSGVSADTRALLASAEPAAREALDLFAFRIAREIAATACTLGGLDALVFTAGIGQHQPAIRAAVAERLAWLGVTLDQGANDRNLVRIGAPEARVAVLVIPTDEEQVIAAEAVTALRLNEAAAR